MKIDQFRPICGTCRFGCGNNGMIDCGLWDHELQPDVVRFTDDLGSFGRPFNAKCGLLILNSDPSSRIHTPGYWPNRRETVRLTVARVIKIVLGNELEGHRC